MVHEPWLRYILGQLEIVNTRYGERCDAIIATQTLAVANIQEAVRKAEAAQTAYNERSNEFRAALQDQASRLLPKEEYQQRHEALVASTQQLFKAMDDKLEIMRKDIIALREYRSQIAGAEQRQVADRGRSQWTVNLWVLIIISGFSGVMGIIGILVTLWIHMK